MEAAYAYLLEYPLLGLTVLRQGDDFQLVTTGQVAASVDRCRLGHWLSVGDDG